MFDFNTSACNQTEWNEQQNIDVRLSTCLSAEHRWPVYSVRCAVYIIYMINTFAIFLLLSGRAHFMDFGSIEFYFLLLTLRHECLRFAVVLSFFPLFWFYFQKKQKKTIEVRLIKLLNNIKWNGKNGQQVGHSDFIVRAAIFLLMCINIAYLHQASLGKKPCLNSHNFCLLFRFLVSSCFIYMSTVIYIIGVQQMMKNQTERKNLHSRDAPRHDSATPIIDAPTRNNSKWHNIGVPLLILSIMCMLIGNPQLCDLYVESGCRQVFDLNFDKLGIHRTV